MAESSYKTIRTASQDEYIVKKSRFIGHIMPVTTQEQALEFIAKVSKKHWDATHNVYAYILRESGIKRYSDDGEPQGTAGIPVLDVLEKTGVTDCAVVVTRYFGGIMLGAGGLVRAYSHTSKIAVDAAGIIKMSVCTVMSVTCDYNFYGRLSSLVPEFAGVIEDTVFGENVTVSFYMPKANVPLFDAKLVDLSLGKISSVKICEKYAQIE